MSTPDPQVVYVITDLDPEPPPRPWAAIRRALRPTALISVIAVPIFAATAVPAGLLLGWHPLVLALALVAGGPVLVNLLDLAGARLGWPPLAWTASQILAARRSPTTSKETRTDG